MRVLRTFTSRRYVLVGGPLVLVSLGAGVLLPASAAQAQETCGSSCLPTAVDWPSSDPLRQLTSSLSLTPASLPSPSSGDDVAEQAARDARLAARRAAAERAAVQRAAAERAAAAAAERAAAAAAERTAADQAAVEQAAVEQAAVEQAAVEQAAVEQAAVEQAAVERTQTGVPTPSPLWSPRTGPSPAQEGRTRADPGLTLQAPAATNGTATGPLAPAPSDGQPETAKQAGSNEEPLAGFSGGAARPDDAAGAQGDGAASSGDAGSSSAAGSSAAGSSAAGSTAAGSTAAGSTAAGSTAAGSTAAGSTAAGSTAAPRATTGPSAATQPQFGQAASASSDTTRSRSVPLVTALIGGVLALLVLIVREIVR